MSVDLSDKSILPAYEDIVSGGSTRWLLLKYSTRDKLFLTTSGSGGIDELKSLIIRDEIQFGFYRIDDLDSPNTRFALLSYVPFGTSGVLRARSLVHGRTVASLFHKAYSAMISFSDVSQISQGSILKHVGHDQPSRDSLENQTPLQNGKTHSAPSPVSTDRKLPAPPSQGLPSRLVTKFTESVTPRQEPPPTPPKPSFPSTRIPEAQGRRVASEAIARTSEYDAQLGHERQQTSPTLTPPSNSVKIAPRLSAPPVIHRIHRRGPSLEQDPDFHTRMRLELQRSRQRAAQEIEEAEAEANSLPRIVKKREQYDLIEEERKKAEEKERQRWMATRRMREEAKKKQEEEEERIREQKRAENQARKLEAARVANERREQAKLEMEQAEKVEAEKSRMRRAASKANLAKIKKQHALTTESVKEGYVYVQPTDSVTWKRRYFVLSKVSMDLYRDNKKTKLLESLDFSQGGLAVKEWDEGFDELRSIPHSFALVFNGGEPWSFYADSGEEKSVIISLVTEN